MLLESLVMALSLSLSLSTASWLSPFEFISPWLKQIDHGFRNYIQHLVVPALMPFCVQQAKVPITAPGKLKNKSSETNLLFCAHINVSKKRFWFECSSFPILLFLLFQLYYTQADSLGSAEHNFRALGIDKEKKNAIWTKILTSFRLSIMCERII